MPMDFQQAVNLGYYFDRCVDLYFYDSEKELLGTLKCPKRSIKPAITVKGEFIEGGYAISSYISVQNMSYDVDVNAVAYIDCHMYYSGLDEAPSISEKTEGVKHGHSVFFSVLYADQEKEPPNRAVRFQCTVAAQDKERFDIPIVLAPDAKIVGGDDKVDFSGQGSKKTSVKLITVLSGIAKVHNNNINKKKFKVNNKNAIRIAQINESLLINAIQCNPDIAEKSVTLPPGHYTIGDLIRKLNSCKTGGSGDNAYCEWKISVNAGVLDVNNIIPNNWREIAINLGYKSGEQQDKFYNSNFAEKPKLIYLVSEGKFDYSEQKGSNEKEPPVFLNYIKSAYRTENNINVTTIYDDRIRPGCICVIQGNAIMGRHSGRGGKSGSRLIQTTNHAVAFRVTGGVNYEFSTTEDSSMTLVGSIYDDDFTPKKYYYKKTDLEGPMEYPYEGDID